MHDRIVREDAHDGRRSRPKGDETGASFHSILAGLRTLLLRIHLPRWQQQ
jgi:hypothetical protein